VNSQPFGDWEAEENGTEKRRESYGNTEFNRDAATSMEEEAIFVHSYKSRARNLDLEHILDVRSPGDHLVQVWSQSNDLPARRSDFRDITKVSYHVTFDLDLNLEHILDTHSPWRSSCARVVAIQPFFCKKKRFS